MVIGIKYEPKRSFINKMLETTGNAIIRKGKSPIFFTNPIVALRVMNRLALKNKALKYSLYMPDIYERVLKDKEFIVSSMDEYLALKEKISNRADAFEKALTNEDTKPNI